MARRRKSKKKIMNFRKTAFEKCVTLDLNDDEQIFIST